jgi:hypothetical protein
MIVIQKIKNVGCLLCNEMAVKSINGQPFCPHCLDAQLIRIIATCSRAPEEVVIKFKVIPKGVLKNGK